MAGSNLPQTNHAGLLGSSQRERHPLSGNLRLPVRRVDPVLFRYRQRALQRQGGIRPLIFTSYGSSFPFFWTPCGPSGFGFTEQLVQFVRWGIPSPPPFAPSAPCAQGPHPTSRLSPPGSGNKRCFLTFSKSGSGENRTHGGFQDRCLRPLSHASLSQRLRIGYLRERKNKSRSYRGSRRSWVGRIPFPWLLNRRLTLTPRPTREAA